MSDLPRTRLKVRWVDGLVHLVHSGKRPMPLNETSIPEEEPFVTTGNGKWFCSLTYSPARLRILKDDVHVTCMGCIAWEEDDGTRS